MADVQLSPSYDNSSFLASIIETNVPNTEQDLLILVTHAVLLRNGFKITDTASSELDNATKLEGLAMPSGWNKQADPDCYEFSYVKAGSTNVHTLRALRIDDTLHVNFVRKGLSEHEAGKAKLDVADSVQRKKKPIALDWLSDYAEVWRCLENGLFGKAENKAKKRKFSFILLEFIPLSLLIFYNYFPIAKKWTQIKNLYCS